MTKARNIANTTLTLGSTTLTLGSATTSVSGLTLSSPNISTITNTGTITLPTSTGTLALNNQTFYIGTQAIAINSGSGTITSLPGVTSINGASLPSSGTIPNTGQTFYIGTQAITISQGTGTITSIPGLSSINGISHTPNATGFSLAGGTTSKTLTVSNSITLAGTDGTTITLPATTGTVALNNQTFYIGTQPIAINAGTGTVTSLPGVTSINGTTIPNAATLTTSTSTFNLGTTSIALNRTSASQSLTGISIDGNAGTVTNGVYTNASSTIIGTVTAQSFIPSSSTIPANGIYLPAANTVGIASNTAQRMTFDANGSINLFGQTMESATISATAANTTVTYDAITNKNILYYTTNASANWTFNVRGSATVSLNTLMAVGQSLTVVFLVTNGATAFYPTAFQIDGGAITPKWQGGTAPTSGNINSIDSYSYTIVKTAATPTYTVFASQTKFA